MTQIPLKPDDLTPEQFQQAIDSGQVTIKSEKGDLKLLSKWKFEDKIYHVYKISDHDYSIFDGVGILDCTFTNRTLAEFSMRNSGAVRVIG